MTAILHGIKPKYEPHNCPVCEYDRGFPDTKQGGWIYPGNNSALWPCWGCNPQHPSFAVAREKRDV